MRLRRLDLTRYGKFTGQVIDFGPAAPDAPDLHIIYGLNEAGKSTTFAAFLDLLFGIPERSPYNFLHPYNTMQIGARLEFDGAEHELVRLKQRTGSLVGSGGQAVNEALLAGALGGIGRDAYRTMFSLDDQSLKDGGAAILQSRGELGELLFSASSGLAGLSRALVTAAEEASEIYRKRSSTTELARLKQSLASLKAERDGIDTFAAAYAALTASHVQASGAYDAAMTELAQLRAAHARIDKQLSALPLARELRRLRLENEAQGEMPRPPAEWFALLPKLSQDETRLQALHDAARRAIDAQKAAIDAIEIDDAVLAAANAIAGLDDLRDRYRTAEADLPKRRATLAAQNALLNSILAELDCKDHPEPESLLLPAAIVGELRALIESRSGVDAALEAAEREARRAEQMLTGVNGEEDGGDPDADGDPDRVRRLEAALADARKSDLPARLTVERRAARQLQRDHEALLSDLAPWSGDAEALRSMPTAEPRRIETWRSEANAIERRIADSRARHRDLLGELRQVQARLDGLQASGAIDDAEAARLRSSRDEAWQRHLASLDRESAKAFEESMQRDDAVSAQRLTRAQDLAELRQLALRLAELRAATDMQAELLAEAAAEREGLLARLTPHLPFPPDTDTTAVERVAMVETWSDRRGRALSAFDAWQKAQAALGDIEQALDDLETRLRQALAAAGWSDREPENLAEAVEAASALIEAHRTRLTARENQRKRLEQLARDAADRQRALERAESARSSWTERWDAALARTWFPEHARTPSAVKAMLEALSSLPAALSEQGQLTQRIATMERDQQQFRQELVAVLDQLGMKGSVEAPLAAAEMLKDRLETALRGQQIRAERQVDLEKQTAALQALDGDMAIHEARKRELTDFFGADTLAAVALRLETIAERQRRDERIEQLERQIADILQVADFDAAAGIIEEIDALQLEAEAADLSARMESLAERTRQLFADMTRARDRLDAVGGDDAVAQIEARRRTVLLEIEDQALRYLRLRTGGLAAEQALHLYREKHRSSMMNRASDAFSIITGGAYSGLATRPDKDREILIGVARDGSSKLAETMSTGTQFQLYLALRLAGYEEFASVRPPVPFVADDIMESFDDPRSEEVFRLLGQMARVGQVIYLTHHRHLCEIAQRVVPGVQIHPLG